MLENVPGVDSPVIVIVVALLNFEVLKNSYTPEERRRQNRGKSVGKVIKPPKTRLILKKCHSRNAHQWRHIHIVPHRNYVKSLIIHPFMTARAITPISTYMLTRINRTKCNFSEQVRADDFEKHNCFRSLIQIYWKNEWRRFSWLRARDGPISEVIELVNAEASEAHLSFTK